MSYTDEKRDLILGKAALALLLIIIILSGILPARGEMMDETDMSYIELEEEWIELADDGYGNDIIYDDVNSDGSGGLVILEDPAFLFGDEEDEIFPVITSVGKSNVKVHGVISKYRLVKYTIPEQLLRQDDTFLHLMIEAEKYIGYPYVYGAANPDVGFDCSGFVCWVFNHSGVYKTKRVGANGLYSLCTDIPREEARPGDLVFFEKTMGASVKGITHVGIYVGNNMMIHAGDPVGFADLKSEQWAKKIYAFGRLPID